MKESWESVLITVVWVDIEEPEEEWVSNFTDQESCELFLKQLTLWNMLHPEKEIIVTDTITRGY